MTACNDHQSMMKWSHSLCQSLAVPKVAHKNLKSNNCFHQSMFGDHQEAPPGDTSLQWAWTCTHNLKLVTMEEKAKSHNTHNDSSWGSYLETLEETHTSCLEQMGHCLTWASITTQNHIATGSSVWSYDGPKKLHHIEVDDQFRDLFDKLKWEPFLSNCRWFPSWRISKATQKAQDCGPNIFHRVQGWATLHTPTTAAHKPCVHSKHHGNDNHIVLCQVDDFLVSSPSVEKDKQHSKNSKTMSLNPHTTHC